MDASSYPTPIVVEPRDGSVATSACIMLHGLGDTGRGWAGAATQIATPRHEKVRWIFPTAKTVPVTLNGGMRMTAWFDLNALDESSIVDDRGMIEESARYVDALVREQMEKGIPSEKIIVAGFSQGGAIALTASLRSEVKLGGCMALDVLAAARRLPGKVWTARARAENFARARDARYGVAVYVRAKIIRVVKGERDRRRV